MPPRKALPPASTAASKQKKFKPPFLIPPPSPHPPAPQSSAGESQPSQSQGGDEDIVTLGQILESMMKVVCGPTVNEELREELKKFSQKTVVHAAVKILRGVIVMGWLKRRGRRGHGSRG